MSTHAISADEKLTLTHGPGHWRLDGPDGMPVLEVRMRTLFYHPLFGQWRDLPPGDRISVDGIECVQVRWDGGWAVGITLAPGGVWRRLVRWTDSRDIIHADDAARALSELIGAPLRTNDNAEPPVVRVGYARPTPGPSMSAGDTPPPVRPAPVRSAVPATPSGPSPVYTIDTAPDIRLPLRLGNGAVLTQESEQRLRLTIPSGVRGSSAGVTILGLLVVALFVAVLWGVRSGAFPVEPALGVALGGGLLIAVGLIGVILLSRLDRRLADQVVFDRAARMVTIHSAQEGGKPTLIPLAALHGVRLQGAVVTRRRHLAYRRSVALIVDSGDISIFDEVRETALPPDPAVMPSLVALRHQADQQAGPSLARAAARVIAWFLAIPLADE